MAIPLPEVDRLCKLIPALLNITLQEALEKEPDLRRACESDPRYAQLMDHALQLEGHTRHAGVHAAGVIVATRPLREIIPLYKPPGSESDETITQWDGPTCEKMGLLKMDFLGLRTISVIERAKKLIREALREEEIWEAVGRKGEYETLHAPLPADRPKNTKSAKGAATPGSGTPSAAHPLDLDRLTCTDQRVLELFRRGETTGIFQFESGGMRRLLVEMKPDRLEDLIAANALFRPGPMDLIPDYNRRKHGQAPVPTLHEIVDRFTAETYGVMVYQEQVMQIVHGLGGIKLRDAYTLIKNISKKKFDKIEKERPKFIQGAVGHGLTPEQSNDLFELILKFAGYGFNKSHSTGYAIVAYQTAYLKTYFPNQYMAAFLSYESQAGKASDWIPYLEDCRRTRFVDPASGGTVRVGVEVRPPDLNLSRADFAVVVEGAGDQTAIASHRGHVRFGLSAIKGAGDKAIRSIIQERDTRGPFRSLFDLCERVPTGVLNKGMLEALIKCGALDALHGRELRAAMLAGVDQAMAAGQRLAQDRAAGQGALFGGSGAAAPGARESALPRVTPWTEPETLAHEKDALGFYVSSHPLDHHRVWAGAFATSTISGCKEQKQDARVVLAAMVQSVRTIVVRNGRSAGQKMAILTIEDLSGAMEGVLFTDQFQKYGHLATAEAVLFVLGRLDLSRGDPQVIIEKLVPIDGMPFDSGKVRLIVDEKKLNGGASGALGRAAGVVRAAATRQAPKELVFPVEVIVGTPEHFALLAADPTVRVGLDARFFEAVEAELGEGTVRVIGVTKDPVETNPKRWQRRGEE